MRVKHIHHIIPKHLGGTDDPDNLIELSIEEHAEAHRLLYEKHGRWEDLLAWQGLAGLISKEELVKQMLSEAGKRGAAVSNSKRKGMKYNWKNPNRKPVGTGGMKWYHNPNDPKQKCCIKDGDDIPVGWIKGQGKKSKNPGVNFHSKKKNIFDGPEHWESIGTE